MSKAYLVIVARELAASDLCAGANKVTALEPRKTNGRVLIHRQRPDGPKEHAGYLVACELRPVRHCGQMVGAEFRRPAFEDQFLIADVRMSSEIFFRPKRWFWFDPAVFMPGRWRLLPKPTVQYHGVSTCSSTC